MTTSSQTTDPMIGRLIDGRYEVRSRVARGGMATVYLAIDRRLERQVALKIMHHHLADDEQFTQRFIQEARSAARLSHPNVVNVFDQGQDADSAYLVMEYLPGITLRELLQEYSTLTAEQTMDIAEAVLSGLAAAHRAGIVHRDLKPENVLLADDGRIKIGDFGLARAASANTATGAALLGTVAYLSPELVTRGIADTRSDIYAAGIMMYEMLTGEQPFKGEQPMQIAFQHANDTVPAPSSVNNRVPAELDELVLWATARDPDERPADAGELLLHLTEVQQLLQSSPQPVTGAQPTMVLPASATTVLGATAPSTAETQVLGPRRTARTAAPETPAEEPAARLGTRTRARRRRGWIALLLVLLLAGAGVGAGWWFGAGPGSQVVVPDSLAGLTPDAARDALIELGLEPTEATGEIHDPLIEPGLVAATDPAFGSTVNRGTTVTLLLSIGPQMLPLPTVIGTQEDVARPALEGAGFTVAEESITYFNAEAPAGQVIDLLDAAGSSLASATEYGELQQTTLVVSLGPIPDVAGLSPEEAQQALEAVGLRSVLGDSEYSDTVPKGNVIRAIIPEGPISTGAELTLITSRGVEQVAVPDVAGEPWSKARKVLEDAGFKVKYSPIADVAPGQFRVESTDPAGGTSVDKGATVTVQLTFRG
ncbi:Stk1 family PASTA domain-containing Ser/Thr kinase [Klugiella sp. YN-L-19]|uniref:non-specific serine/threonine protein kinase n=2 Tax=Ruicaihuangia caeni TaxID=3042517 RepID=A0AAW6T369_9MICO|nr:Stk1 family PASTA domain-containing Ser/Thr kinase [Klugiella sp. YN-L-19]MDI2098256.1 Stk1 family PASTA domain-containing Ser/Thr kinase [Klugiella sp. YN-L-19]